MDRKNWQDSVDKWVKIITKTKNKVKLIKTKHDNFLSATNIPIIAPCGFCFEWPYGCYPCPLYKDKICYRSRSYSRTTFWRFCREMAKPKPDFDKCLKLAEEILEAIKKYEPEDYDV
jgi:hypothetical protein